MFIDNCNTYPDGHEYQKVTSSGHQLQVITDSERPEEKVLELVSIHESRCVRMHRNYQLCVAWSYQRKKRLDVMKTGMNAKQDPCPMTGYQTIKGQAF